jgi:hypothetical protein
VTAIEYAITKGEGTLLDHGVAIAVDFYDGEIEIISRTNEGNFARQSYKGATVVARPCEYNCETGK